MTKYLKSDPFSSRPMTKEYAEGWDRIFGKKEEKTPLEIWTQSTDEAKKHVIAELAALDTPVNCSECNDAGYVWASDEHHGHAVKIRCNCRNNVDNGSG